MKIVYRLSWVLWMALCFAVLIEERAHAGDCSGPSDCSAIPDNATKAAAAGGIVAGAAAASRKKKKKGKDVDEGEGKGAKDDAGW
jgi:hypothetical protein